ncbi:EamA family transporter [Profundibacter sp.]|uniref:EamA family transporter n=1 Tax=Profundibacter sp. TaxID=3101071 RepID=UPI003D098A04
MSTFVFLTVMGAALLHATWNALIKTGGNKLTSMLIMTIIEGAVGVVVAMTQRLPQGEVWFWVIGSGMLHSAYKFFLAFAYEHGDLSRVYPIARGTAPMIVMLVSLLFLSDVISGYETLGIALLGVGILMMARGVFTDGESRRLVPLALCSAMATAAYSLVDGMGARVAGDAAMYVAWLFVFDVLGFVPMAYALRGRQVFIANRRSWGLGAVAALASYGAYAIAVWAMTQAPIALVAALRETSILFAVLIGWLLFGERLGRVKALSAALIVAGVMLTRI